MKNIILLAVVSLVISISGCNLNKSDNNSSQFSILNYGAVGDAETMNTKAIQSTIDACADAGGGTVIIPKGKFLTGTIILKSNIEIHIMRNATLLGSKNHVDYPPQPMSEYRALRDEGGFNALIYAEGVSNIAITGDGTIDGQGQFNTTYDELKEGEKDDRPKNLMLISCSNIMIRDIHMQNSAFWNQHYLNCEDILIDNITVYNHSNHNNDALDIDGCRRVVVSNCNFDSVDDALVLKATGKAGCEDVVITNCILSSFTNAIKTGTETTGGFKNISISNCVVKPSRHTGKRVYDADGEPDSGYSAISLIIVDGGVMEGVTINNIVVEGTQAPIYIRLGNRARKHIQESPTPPVGIIRNISISNIVAYGVGLGTSSIEGLKGYPIQNVSLSNIQLGVTGGLAEGNYSTDVVDSETGYPEPHYEPLPASGLYMRHIDGITINSFAFGVKEKDDRAVFWVDDVSKLLISDVRLQSNYSSKYLVRGSDLTDYKIEKPLGWSKIGKHVQLSK